MSLAYSLEQRSPLITEMIFILIVGAGFTINMTNFDINQHFYYVLPDQSFCNQTQINNPFCINLWNNLGLQIGDQAHIPDRYWANLNMTVLSFGALLALSRFAGTYILSKALKINILHHPEKIYKILAYGVTVTILPLFSYGDYLYYILQHKPLPLAWSWLNGLGIFPYILKFTHEKDVTTMDVYIAMIIGTLIAIGVWFPILYTFHKNKGIVKQIV